MFEIRSTHVLAKLKTCFVTIKFISLMMITYLDSKLIDIINILDQLNFVINIVFTAQRMPINSRQ